MATAREPLLAIANIDVGVVGIQPIAVRVDAIVGAARCALPLETGAQPRPRDATRRGEPGGVGIAIVPRHAGDREIEPVLVGVARASR